MPIPKGYLLSGISCGIKTSGKKDLALLVSQSVAKVAAMFTSNKVVAAPVICSQQQLKNNQDFSVVLINSGNANACTGKLGLEATQKIISSLAKKLCLEANKILIASTGIIGKQLEVKKVASGLDLAINKLTNKSTKNFAEAILTTDRFTKQTYQKIKIGNCIGTITGIAKGAGMISPSLIPHATMIAIIFTDLAVDLDFLNQSLEKAVEVSFNSISVDGDMSTNDTVFLLANGRASNLPISKNSAYGYRQKFQMALKNVCVDLAKLMVKDGEGATKVVCYTVEGAKNNHQAKQVAKQVANSLLVKTALFGKDLNWGRFMAAIGASGIELDLNKISIHLDNELIVDCGCQSSYDVKKVNKIMKQEEITVKINLNLGDSKWRFFGCDLSYDYLKLNSQYHS